MSKSKKNAETVIVGGNRANRVVVTAIDGGWVAEFFKTHAVIGAIVSIDSEWVANPTQTLTGQREDFRTWSITNCHLAGATWVPDDLREDWNVRVPKYSDDMLVHQDINKMIVDLVLPNFNLTKLGITFLRTDFEEIVPVTKTSKGADIKYVSDGRYDKTGNWAWCTIPTTLVFDHSGTEIYVTRNFELVSGCLKKMRITIPEFDMEVRSQITVAEVVGA